VAGKTYWDPATEHSVPQKTTKLKQIELPPAGKNH